MQLCLTGKSRHVIFRVMAVSKHLLEILRCPQSRSELIYFAAGTVEEEEFLFCPESKLRYRIEEGIPVMLIDEAEALDDATCARLVGHVKEI